MEVRIFAIDGSLASPETDSLIVAAEVFRGGKWSKEAEDTLKQLPNSGLPKLLCSTK